MQKQGRSSQETIVQPWDRVLVPPQGIYRTISLSSSAGTKVPTQVEDSNFRLSSRFLEHHPVTSPPTNQKKVTHSTALTPNFAYKNFSPKTIRGASLVAQWLRIHLPMQGTRVQALGQEDPTCCRGTKPVRHNY